MNKTEEQAFFNVVKDALSKQHKRGLKEGAYAMCKVVLEHATEEHKSTDERLEEVIKFCKTLVENEEKERKERKKGANAT